MPTAPIGSGNMPSFPINELICNDSSGSPPPNTREPRHRFHFTQPAVPRPSLCPCFSVRHCRRESAVALVFWLPFPTRTCLSRCPSCCHSRLESAVAFWLSFPTGICCCCCFLAVILKGNLLSGSLQRQRRTPYQPRASPWVTSPHSKPRAESPIYPSPAQTNQTPISHVTGIPASFHRGPSVPS